MSKRAALVATLVVTALALLLSFVHAPPLAVFVASAIAILGLAGALGTATEELGGHLGHKVGAILNATVGNVGEILIAIFALRAGLIDFVKASITGSIIGNLLLVLGASALVGGRKHGVQRFDPRTAGMHAAQLVLATIGLLVPALFAHLVHVGAPPGGASAVGPEASIEGVTLGVACVLLVTYGLSVAYDLSRPAPPRAHATAVPGSWRAPLARLVVAAALLGWLSEVLVGAIEPVIDQFGLSPLFLGAIVIPIIGNLSENYVALELARKNQIEFSLAIALGSATQVALFAAPVLVFASLLLGHPLTLVFTPFEVVAVGAGAVVTALLCLDGETNWLEGAQLLATYLILAVAFYFLPGGR
jgi:Ca2+:H+ antiporter